MCPWIDEFEKCFGIANSKTNSPNSTQTVRIIVGLSQYKKHLEYAPNKYEPYSVTGLNGTYAIYETSFPEIAFLTNDWLCITSTLEMIFRLLFIDHATAVCAIGWLKKHSVSPIKFANYLWCKHHIVLANCDVNETQQLYDKLIKRTSIKKVYILCLGLKNSFYLNSKGTTPSTKAVLFGKVLHPSSRNVNSKRYYKTWYLFDDTEIITPPKAQSFSFKDFAII